MTVKHPEVPSGAPPSATVLAAFDLKARPVPLPEGQGRSWLVGPVALKPLDMPLSALRWQAELLTRLDDRDELRVSVPLCTADGQWTSHGWTAWRHQPGEHLHGRWHDVVAVGERLHAALGHEPEPAFLTDRADVWAIADRVAWGELPAEDYAATKRLDTLLQACARCPAWHSSSTAT